MVIFSDFLHAAGFIKEMFLQIPRIIFVLYSTLLNAGVFGITMYIVISTKSFI